MAAATTAATTAAICGAVAIYLFWRKTPREGPSITAEDIAKFPGRAGIGSVDAPGLINFSPDGTCLTYLASPPGSLSRTLCKQDLATGEVSTVLQDSSDESSYSLEEKLRRERLRLLHTGVSHYEWASESTNLLIPQGSRVLVVLSKLSDEPCVIVDADKAGLPKEGTIMDPKLSSDGKLCVFVLAQEVYACATDGSMVAHPVQLTSGARGTALNNGSADFLAQEEMDRMEGFWVSPDNRTLAFEQFDESHIPLFTLPHYGDDPNEVETHRYPFAGAANPKVKLGLVQFIECTVPIPPPSPMSRSPSPREMRHSPQGSPRDTAGEEGAQDIGAFSPIWVDLGADEDIYIARVDWKDSQSLLVQVQNRHQTENKLLLVDAATGSTTTLLTERDPKYVNLHLNLVPLADGDFIWSSEESGFMHLAVHNADGTKRIQLTSGGWVVDGTCKSMVDEGVGTVYFLGNKTDLREKHLYKVPLIGGAITQVTQESGMHTVKLSRNFSTFVDSYNGLGRPACVRVCSLSDGAVLRVIFESTHPDLIRLRPLLEPPEMVSFPSTDGKVTLFAAVYKPPASIFGRGPFPTVVEVYGGPHLQNVTKSWGCTADLRAHHLRLSGYLVLKLDNRGSARRCAACHPPPPLTRSLGYATRGLCNTRRIPLQVEGVETVCVCAARAHLESAFSTPCLAVCVGACCAQRPRLRVSDAPSHGRHRARRPGGGREVGYRSGPRKRRAHRDDRLVLRWLHVRDGPRQAP